MAVEMSGEALLLILLVGQLERDTIVRGDKSMIDRLEMQLKDKTQGNIVDLTRAKEAPEFGEARQDALDILAFGRTLADIAARLHPRSTQTD